MTTTSVPDINRSTSQQPGIAQATVDNTTDDNETRQFHSASFRETIGPTVTLPSDSTALDFFSLVFGDDTYEMIAEETNRYAWQSPPGDGYTWHDTSKEEIQQFLGVIIPMGIHSTS